MKLRCIFLSYLSRTLPCSLSHSEFEFPCQGGWLGHADSDEPILGLAGDELPLILLLGEGLLEDVERKQRQVDQLSVAVALEAHRCQGLANFRILDRAALDAVAEGGAGLFSPVAGGALPTDDGAEGGLPLGEVCRLSPRSTTTPLLIFAIFTD